MHSGGRGGGRTQHRVIEIRVPPHPKRKLVGECRQGVQERGAQRGKPHSLFEDNHGSLNSQSRDGLGTCEGTGSKSMWLQVWCQAGPYWHLVSFLMQVCDSGQVALASLFQALFRPSVVGRKC